MDKIKKAVTDKTKAILINSPSNPAGTVFDETAIEDIAHFCHDNNIWLVTDEVYWSLCFDGKHISPYSIEEYRDKIFEVFNRLVSESEFEGTGVGLSIVKRILERHQGKVEVESVVGKGTTIEMLFPWSHSVEEDIQRLTGSPRLTESSNARVLIVDNEPMDCRNCSL